MFAKLLDRMQQILIAGVQRLQNHLRSWTKPPVTSVLATSRIRLYQQAADSRSRCSKLCQAPNFWASIIIAENATMCGAQSPFPTSGA